MGGAAAAFATHTALEWGEMAARFEGTRSVFVQAGGDLANLRKQTRGLVSDMGLVKDFNFAEQFGFGNRLPEFFKIANAASKKFGMDKEEALKKLIFGIALRSTPLLKNVGINVKGDAKAILEAYANLHHLQAKTLTHAQQAQAYADEAVKQGAAMVREVGETGQAATDSYGRMHASLENVRVAFGRLANAAFQKMAPAFEAVAHWIERISQSRSLNRFMEQFAEAMTAVITVVGPFASVAVDLVRTLGLIPGAGYLVAAMLLGPLYTGFVSTILVLGRVVPGLSAAFNMLRHINVWLPVFASNFRLLAGAVWATWAPLIGLGAAALLAALAMEELFAEFDDRKIGLFESFAGRWGDLVSLIGNAPAVTPWQKFFQGVKIYIVDLIGLLDLYVQTVMGAAIATFDLLTLHPGEALNDAKTAVSGIGQSAKGLWDANAAYLQGLDRTKLSDGTYATAGLSYRTPTHPPASSNTRNSNTVINIHGVKEPVDVASEKLKKANRDAHQDLTPAVPRG